MTACVNSGGQGDVLAHVISILADITSDWDPGVISATTRLGALNLESINFVYFIAELQQKYALQQRLLARIKSTDTPFADLMVGDVAAFVQEVRGPQEGRNGEAAS
jgi:acyl carrier protein